MLKDNISLPASPLATTLMCELFISVKDQTRTVPKLVNAFVVLNCEQLVDYQFADP